MAEPPPALVSTGVGTICSHRSPSSASSAEPSGGGGAQCHVPLRTIDPDAHEVVPGGGGGGGGVGSLFSSASGGVGCKARRAGVAIAPAATVASFRPPTEARPCEPRRSAWESGASIVPSLGGLSSTAGGGCGAGAGGEQAAASSAIKSPSSSSRRNSSSFIASAAGMDAAEVR